ncbi:MAG: DUF4189 domain-containing protein [Pseudomonadota bacterium]
MKHAPIRKCLQLAALILCGTSVLADDLNPEWQARRDAMWDLGKASCNSREALSKLQFKAAADRDPVAAYWIYYSFQKKDCANYNPSLANARLRTAAKAGYPVAQRAYGRNLMQGRAGFPRDMALGKEMLERARDAGFGLAAGDLAFFHSDGRYLPVNEAEVIRNYQIAVNEGVVEASMKDLRRQLPAHMVAAVDAAVKGPTASVASLASKTPASPGLFAALAVKNGDGTFGFAFDQPSEAAARESALSECRSRGGDGCEAKLVLRGPACIAYHSSPGASAFGWGYAKHDVDATNRAASECQTHNGDKTCRSTAWSCNTRTDAPIDVVFEAPNAGVVNVPPYDLSACHILTHVECRTDSQKVKTNFVFGITQVDYPGCHNEKYASSGTTYTVSKDWFRKSTLGLSDAGVPAHRAKLDAGLRYVQQNYPSCDVIRVSTNGYGTKSDANFADWARKVQQGRIKTDGRTSVDYRHYLHMP